MGDMRVMTMNGTFVVNGHERVIVSQMHRSPGVFFDHDKGKTHSSGKLLFAARVIPYRGSWLDIEFDAKDIVFARIDRRRKIPVTSLMFALGLDGEQILSTFYKKIIYKRAKDGWRVPFDPTPFRCYSTIHHLVTTAADKNMTREERLFDICRVMRPGGPPTIDSAQAMFQSLFFDSERYDLSAVGRVKMNMRLELDAPDTHRTLRKEDILAVIKTLVDLRDGKGEIDDIDHLGNRRVRSVGELMQNQYPIRLLRMQRASKERMSSVAIATVLLDAKGRFTGDMMVCRHAGEVLPITPDKVDYMDVSPKQLVSVAAALIPFLENDDANRALMGSNMQRQAVPLVRAEAPFVGTGMEGVVAPDSGAAIAAPRTRVVGPVAATPNVSRATRWPY